VCPHRHGAGVLRSARVNRGHQAGFVLDAPLDTNFLELKWSGEAQRRDCRYALADLHRRGVLAAGGEVGRVAEAAVAPAAQHRDVADP
jgi:hypothetical protein